MSTRTTHYETCLETERRIEQYMPTDRWKAIKSLLYAALAVGLAAFAITADADPTVAMGMGMFLLLIFYGVEVHEVEIARWVSITFKNGHRDEAEDD